MTTASAAPSPFHDGRPDPGAAGVRLAELFEEHARLVLRLCRGLLRDAAEAEDAAQQTFLSAYRSLLDGVEPREPAAWLATIARHECLARIRATMRRPLAVAEPDDALPAPLTEAMERSDVAALREALAELPRQQRRAFLLREFSGLSYGELAEALGVSGSAVESLLFRARRQLRTALAPINALTVPIALRDQLMRAIPGFESPSAGVVAKLAALPVAAKLAAAGAGVAVVATGAMAVQPERHHESHPARAVPAAPAPAVRESREASKVERDVPVRATVARAVPSNPVRSEHRGDGQGREGQAAEGGHVGRGEGESGPGSHAESSQEGRPAAVEEAPASEDHSGSSRVGRSGQGGDESSASSSGPGPGEAQTAPSSGEDDSGSGSGSGSDSGSDSGSGSGDGRDSAPATPEQLPER